MVNLTQKENNRSRRKMVTKIEKRYTNEETMLYMVKKMENLRNRFDVRLVSSKKDYLIWISKSSYISQKMFDNDLVTTRKSKVTLKLNKPAYVEMSILDFSKVLMYEFHYDCIKNKYTLNSRLLFTDTDSLMYKIKTEDGYEDFNDDKKTCFILVIIQLSQNIMMTQTN